MGRVVYFMRPVGAPGPVKIGVSIHPSGRLATYQSWSPAPLEIVATTPGDHVLEHRFHAAFREFHSHHEWFRPAPEIDAAISSIREGTFDPATLPARGWWSGNKGGFKPWTEGTRYRARMYRLSNRTGIQAPRRLAESIGRFDRLAAREQAAIRPLVDAFFAAPHVVGSPMPHPWAVKAFAAYCAKRGLNALALTPTQAQDAAA